MSYLAQPAILKVIGTSTLLERVANGQNGPEFAGPCPMPGCGGNDRFRVQPRENWWYCRQCGENEHWLSPADFLMKLHGISFPEAKKMLGEIEGTRAHVQIIKKAQSELPEPAAQKRMQAFAAAAEERLWSPEGAGALGYLMGVRKLTEHTIRFFRLGCHDGSDKLPRSVTIPLYGLDGNIYGVKCRRAGKVGPKESKYLQVAGSRVCFFQPQHAKETMLVVEGEFDVMAIWQEARHLVDPATLGSSSSAPSARQAGAVVGYRRLLIAYDQDDAGQKGAQRWNWARAIREAALPEGVKDCNQLLMRGGDLAAWVQQRLSDDWNRLEADKLVEATLQQIQCAKYTVEALPEEQALLEQGINAAFESRNRAALTEALIHYYRTIVREGAA